MKLHMIKILTTKIFIVILLTSCTSNYIDYKQHIETDDFNYGFYMDTWGIGDQGYYVLKIEKNISPKEVYVEITAKDGINLKHRDWMDERTILFNYAEAGYHHKSPMIKLIDNRFLVFERGGFNYGLYDLKLQKDTFNISSPWNTFVAESGYKSERYDRKKEEEEYTKWVKNNIHDKINDYILTNK